MKKILIANWKENPKTERQAVALFDATAKSAKNKKIKTVVCPPDIYLEALSKRTSSRPATRDSTLSLGAQDVSMEDEGAHTGEVGPKMLKRLGVTCVIIGHSERRAFGETDGMINKKIKLALADGLKVILCVGECISVHKQGIVATKKFIKGQLQAGLMGIKRATSYEPRATSIIVAYEPIWAIGTGNNAEPDYVREMSTFIKKTALSLLAPRRSWIIRLLYGGSVTSKNISDYVQCKEIDGALVGGASLKAEEVRKMLRVISK